MKNLALVLVLGALGCSHDCTAIGCTTYVNFHLSEALREDGTYLIEVVADGESMSCEVQVPQVPEIECDDKVGITREEVTSNEGGAQTGTAGDAIEAVGVIGIYEQVSIVITRNTAVLADDEVEPDYDEEDHGKGCGSCAVSEHELSVDP